MARADRVAFTPGHRLAVVDVLLNGLYRLDLLADTGAEVTVISRGAGERLRLDPDRPIRRLTMVGIGRLDSVPVYRLARLQVGGVVVADVDVLVHDLPPEVRASGLLGVNVLGRYRTTFDFRQRFLIFRQEAAVFGPRR